MGEGTDRVSVEQLESEIETLRDELVPIVSELDRRRHAALDWRHQARSHPVPLAIAAVLAAGILGWITWEAIEDRRARKRPVEKLRRLRRAIARMIDDPERVAAADPSGLRSVALAIGRAAGTAAAVALAKDTVARVRIAPRTLH